MKSFSLATLSLACIIVVPVFVFGQHYDSNQIENLAYPQSYDTFSTQAAPGVSHVGADGQTYEWQLVPVPQSSVQGSHTVQDFAPVAPVAPVPTMEGAVHPAPVVQATESVVSQPAFSFVPAPQQATQPPSQVVVVQQPAPAPIQQTHVVYVPVQKTVIQPVIQPVIRVDRIIVRRPPPIFVEPELMFFAPEPPPRRHSCLFGHH